MSVHYVRPYVPGSVTQDGWAVVCVPGMRAAEVTEPLASKLTNLVLEKKYAEAQILMTWFGGEVSEREMADAQAR